VLGRVLPCPLRLRVKHYENGIGADASDDGVFVAPVIWDANFLHCARDAAGGDIYVLCVASQGLNKAHLSRDARRAEGAPALCARVNTGGRRADLFYRDGRDHSGMNGADILERARLGELEGEGFSGIECGGAEEPIGTDDSVRFAVAVVPGHRRAGSHCDRLAEAEILDGDGIGLRRRLCAPERERASDERDVDEL